MKSASDEDGSFVPTFQFGKLEIHKVFLRFPNFNLGAKSLALVSCDLISGYMIGNRGAVPSGFFYEKQ